jgi:hypothetical protein
MDTRDLYKLVRELSEERDDVVNLYDSVDLELSEGFVIETGVVGFMEDGVIVHLDEDAMEFLGFNGVLLEDIQMNEAGSSDGVRNAITRRIVSQHTDVLGKFGPAAVMAAIDDKADDLNDLEEIGSSDVSIWTKQVIQDLESGHYAHIDEAEAITRDPEGNVDFRGDAVDSFKAKITSSDDPFDLVYGAISGQYGEEIRVALQDMYDEVVIDSQGRLHPDDDFEPIIDRIIDHLEADSGMNEDEQIDELSAIKKLAHGEEVAEGLGKALLGGAALIAALTGISKKEANDLMKTEPQLITLDQMRHEAFIQNDEEKVEELNDRIKKTLDHIRVTGRPVMGVDGVPVDPRKPVGEAEYQGRKVPLGKPMQGDVKKSKVYVKKPNGKVVKVNFGDKNMTIKKSNPDRRRSFRARHHCENPGPRWKARYWSCRAW